MCTSEPQLVTLKTRKIIARYDRARYCENCGKITIIIFIKCASRKSSSRRAESGEQAGTGAILVEQTDTILRTSHDPFTHNSASEYPSWSKCARPRQPTCTPNVHHRLSTPPNCSARTSTLAERELDIGILKQRIKNERLYP